MSNNPTTSFDPTEPADDTEGHFRGRVLAADGEQAEGADDTEGDIGGRA